MGSMLVFNILDLPGRVSREGSSSKLQKKQTVSLFLFMLSTADIEGVWILELSFGLL